MAPTVHKPVHVKTIAKCDKVTTTDSSAEIHITCSLMNKLILFMITMKKSRPIYTKILMNQIS